MTVVVYDIGRKLCADWGKLKMFVASILLKSLEGGDSLKLHKVKIFIALINTSQKII